MILIYIRLENSLGMNQDRGKNALDRDRELETNWKVKLQLGMKECSKQTTDE